MTWFDYSQVYPAQTITIYPNPVNGKVRGYKFNDFGWAWSLKTCPPYLVSCTYANKKTHP